MATTFASAARLQGSLAALTRRTRLPATCLSFASPAPSMRPAVAPTCEASSQLLFQPSRLQCGRSMRSSSSVVAASAAAGEAATAHAAAPGDFVVAQYSVSLEDGTVVDSSKGSGEPASFILGGNALVPGFHQAVGGLAVGQSRTQWRVSPDDGYGETSPEMIIQIAKSQAPAGLEAGVMVQLTNGMQATVTKVDDESVTIDANHPLAGKTLLFDVTVEKIVPAAQLQRATFGAGCFWSVELAFQRVPGVLQTAVGYSQGKKSGLTYEEVCSGATNANEVVQVVYDPAEVSYEQLLDTFWGKHDPTTLNRQGGDVGTQYRSGIYWHTEEQREMAEASKARQNEKLGGKVVTEIEQVANYSDAEEYHQQYLAKGGRFGRPQSAAKGCNDPIRCYG